MLIHPQDKCRAIPGQGKNADGPHFMARLTLRATASNATAVSSRRGLKTAHPRTDLGGETVGIAEDGVEVD